MALIGLAEMAELFGVTKQVVTNWRSRKAGFPKPIAELKSGPVWDSDSIEIWAETEGLEFDKLSEETVELDEAVRSARIVAMMNMKGGVGKSTLAANLGWFCSHQLNFKVLLVDLDPQFNLSQYILGVRGYLELLDSEADMVDQIFEAAMKDGASVDVHSLVRRVKQWADGSLLHLLPARLDLAWSIRNAPSAANLLGDRLEELRAEYDIILIDCAPTDSMLSDAAYMAADYIFVPVRPEFLSAIGLPLLLQSQARFQERNPTRSLPTFGGVIFNDASEKSEHAKARRDVKEVAALNDLYVFKSELSHSDSYPAGARAGKPIFLTDHARDWKKAELTSVANEFIERIGL